MSHCIGGNQHLLNFINRFKRKPQNLSLNTNISTHIVPYEYVFSSKEVKILDFISSTNELKEQMSTHETLKNMNINQINIPRIVVIGTQSSGKSSVVNKIIGMDILPVGDSMVTRTPLNIRLNKANSNECSIYIYIDGAKEIVYGTEIDKINITVFQNKIIEATNRITDNNFSISNNQIFIDLNSSRFDNMNIIDLPGLVSISCTDKGQSETIVEDIKNLIIEQLEYPETYILTVISSLVDLEADQGLALIKSIQRTNKSLKAIGVLTKSDRLKTISKLDNIVDNKNISKNLMLDDGYFVINNLVSDTSSYYLDTFGVTSSIIKKKRYGITNLKTHLKKTLLKMIKDKLPIIINNLKTIHTDIYEITPKLDDNLNDTIAKLLFINNMMYIMSKSISETFNSISISKNAGIDIKSVFEMFVKETNSLDPFNSNVFTDNELSNIITNFTGYVPNANDITYLVINRCLTDEHKQPIKLILPHAQNCINSLIKIITHIIDDLLRSEKLDIYPLNLNKYNISLNNFPKLRSFILENTIQLLENYRYRTSCNISHLLSIHERHLNWYDQQDFDNYYSKVQDTTNVINSEMDYMTVKFNYSLESCDYPASSTNTINPLVHKMRSLLKICFTKIVKTCQDEIYKTIASDIVKEFEHNFFIEMNSKFILMKEDNLNQLFYETNDVLKNKKIYDNILEKLSNILKITIGIDQ